MNALVQALFWLTLSTWFGAVLFSAIVPPILLRVIREADPTLPRVLSVNLDKQHSTLLAGMVVSELLHTLFRVEAVCAARHGAPIGEMVHALVNAYWDAKTERSEVTRALYQSAVELDNDALVEAFARRTDAATLAMFRSARDAHFTDLELVNLTLLSVIFGTVRNVFERNLPVERQADVREQVIAMCLAYLDTARARQAEGA